MNVPGVLDTNAKIQFPKFQFTNDIFCTGCGRFGLVVYLKNKESVYVTFCVYLSQQGEGVNTVHRWSEAGGLHHCEH